MSELDTLVTIKLDKERHLRLSLKGMIAFEKITGKNLLKGFQLNELTLGDTAAMMWACLTHEDKELTYDDVCCMVDTNNIETAMEALTKCLSQSFPEAKAGSRPLAGKSQVG